MAQLTRHPIPTTFYLGLILVAFGGMLRFYNLSSAPYWMDEGFTINAVLAIVENGEQVLDSGFSYTCPLYCYPSAWFSSIFGDTPFSYRLFSAIAGTLFILVFFLSLRRMLPLRITLVATFFAAFSYFQIAWSRQARWYTLFELFFWLSLFAFYKAYNEGKGRRVWMGLTIIFTAIATQAHELGYLLPFIFGAWMLIDATINKKIPVKVFSGLCLMGIISLVTIVVTTSVELSYLFPLYLTFYFKAYWIFFLLSIIALLHPHNVWKKETRFFSFALLAYVIPLSFFTDIINYRYLFHVTPVFFILGAIGIDCILSDLDKRWMKVAALLVIGGLFFVTGQGVWKAQSMYFLEADGKRFFVPQPDWNAAYGFIKENKKEEEIVITTQPQFNKIFLGEPGYWIRYSYNGKTYMKEKDDKEFYVGAKIINDVAELQGIISGSHGFVTLDFYGEGMIPKEILEYIRTNMKEVFVKTTNEYSIVRVYQF